MNLASIVVKELLGLFVDDGSLAIGILACVAAVAALLEFDVLSPAACGALLIAGLAALLIGNLWRAARGG
jgi:hypothetical protein